MLGPDRSADEAWSQKRPSVPPLLFVALAMWLSLAGIIDGLRLQSQTICLIVAGIGATIVIVSLACLLKSLPAAVCCIMLGAALGAVCGGFQAYSIHAAQDSLVGTASEEAVELAQDAQKGMYGSSSLATFVLDSGQTVKVRLSFNHETDDLVGTKMRIHATWKAPSEKAAVDSWRKGVAASAVVYSSTAVDEEGPLAAVRTFRERSLDVLESVRQGESSPGTLFLEAILFGYRDNLYESSLYSAVRVDGLAHMVAVSGAHLVIVCGIALAFFKRLRFSRPAILGLQIFLISGYLVLTGVPVSAVRAAIMTIIAMSSFLAKRRAYPLGALSVCMIALLALDPAAAFSISFILSASSTMGIVLFSGLFTEWICALFACHRNALVETLALTFAATMVTSPFVAGEFAQFSLIAPIANLVAAPCFTILCGAGLPLVLIAVFIPPLAPMLLGFAVGVCDAFCGLLEILADVPYAAVPFSLDAGLSVALMFVVPLALWLFWPRPSRRMMVLFAGVATAIFLLAAFVLPLSISDRIIMLDVGQGDAFVCRSDGHALLIDTGTNDTELLQGLARNGIYHLDAVLISHPDDDHCGSLSSLQDLVSIDRVLVASDLLSCADKNCRKLKGIAVSLVGDDGVVGLSARDKIFMGNMTFTVVGPEAYTDNGGNADSLVLMMEDDCDKDGTGDWTAMFCGDAESEQLSAYARQGLLNDVDIYKVGHHGSRAAIDDSLAKKLKPEVSLVSVGEGNRYGHPAASTLTALEQAGSTIWRTDRQGEIVCELNPGSMNVVPLR